MENIGSTTSNSSILNPSDREDLLGRIIDSKSRLSLNTSNQANSGNAAEDKRLMAYQTFEQKGNSVYTMV